MTFQKRMGTTVQPPTIDDFDVQESGVYVSEQDKCGE